MNTSLNSAETPKTLRVRKAPPPAATPATSEGRYGEPDQSHCTSTVRSSKRDLLSLAWIDQHLQLAAFRKNTRITPVFSFPGVSSVDELGQRVARFVEESGFRGRQAQCVIEGGPLVSSTETLPPAKPSQQRLYLREKARRMEAESQPIIWESQRLASSKKSPKCLLHYIPSSQLSELIRLFQRKHIALAHLTPAASLATRAIKELLGQIDVPTLVALRAGASIKLFAIDENEQLEFARALNAESASAGERGAIEVNRCLLYARQQFGQPIKRLALVGDAMAAARDSIRQLLGQSVSIVQLQSEQDLWLRPIGRQTPVNLAKEGMLKHRRRRLRQAATMAAYAALAGTCFHYVYGQERRWQAAQRDIARLTAAEPSMEKILQAQGESQALAEQLGAFVANAGNLDRPPVERALLAYLARAMPRDLWLQELEIAWNPAVRLWNVRLLVQSENRASEVVAMGRQLQRSLQDSPLSFQLRHSTVDSLSRVVVQGSGAARQTVVIEGDIAP